MTTKDNPQYRASYEKGWRYSGGESANLDYADSRGYTSNDAWMDGFFDKAAGREKWHLLNCPDHDECGVMTRRPPIAASELMDAHEVADHFGCALSSLRVAMTVPKKNPRLARALPSPLRKVGHSWVWRRVDIERWSRAANEREKVK